MSSRSCFVFYVLYILASFHKEEFRKFNLLIFPKVEKRMLRGTYFPFSTPFVQRVTNCTFLGASPLLTVQNTKIFYISKFLASPASPPVSPQRPSFSISGMLFYCCSLSAKFSVQIFCTMRKKRFLHFHAHVQEELSQLYSGEVNFPWYGQWLGQNPIYSGDP